MKSLAFAPILVMAAGLSCGLSETVSGADVAGMPGYHRCYHKQALPLNLDATRIAVKAVDVESMTKAAMAAGLEAAAAEASVLTGWWLVPAPAKADGAEIERRVAILAAEPGVVVASPVFFDDFGGPAWVAGDVMIGFAADLPFAGRDAVIAGAGKLRVRDYTKGVDRVEPMSRNGFEILAAANAAARRGDVLFAECDMVFTGRAGVIPNDAQFGSLWGIHNTGQSGGTVDQDMDGPEAWDITIGSAAIIVGVIDVGTDLTHPDLNLAPSADFSGGGTGGGPGNACDSHGTPVAGCISARFNNTIGVVGIAPGCRSSSLRAMVSNTPTCNGSWSASGSWTVDALNFAQANGHRVTNNSNGYGFSSAAIETAYANTYAAGIVHFASNGNSGAGTIGYPASVANVNGVSALNRNGNRAGFSQFGPGTDFSAPGVTINSCDRQGAPGYTATDYNVVDGTSFASPYAAGVAALIISRSPGLTSAQVEQVMRNTAVDRGPAGYDTEYGWGFVNAGAALASLAPANDLCGNAVNVSAGGTFNGTLVGAGNDGTATCGSSATNADVWYRYTNGPCNTMLTVTTCGTHDGPGVNTGMDTVLTLFSACGGAQLACNDDTLACGTLDVSPFRDSLVSWSLAPNETVLIRVSKFGPATSGPFVLNVSGVPANDSCASAVDVSAGGTFFCTLAGATNDGTATCGASATNADVWYTFTNSATCPRVMTATTCGTHDGPGLNAGMDTVLALFDVCGGTQLACNDDTVTGCIGLDASTFRDSLVSRTLAPGETVLIRVSKFSSVTAGAFRLNVASTVPNDACASAATIAAGVATAFCSGDATTDGPTEGPCLNAGDDNVHRDVWFRYTPVGKGRFTARTCGSAFDTKLAIYPNVCPGASGTVLACNDDSGVCGAGGALLSNTSAIGVAGTSYLIRVGGYNNQGGDGVVTVFCAADINFSGVVSVQDIFDFLMLYFANSPAADINGVGGLSVQDIFDFLETYFSGC